MKWSAQLMLLSLACLVLAPTSLALADGGAAPRATGEVWFENSGYWATLNFNAHEAYGNRPAKGHVYYADWDGSNNMRYYKVWVDCVEVDGKYATFSGKIYESNVAGWVDSGVQIWVYDGGTPGRNGDMIGGSFFTWPGCLPFGSPAATIPVKSGNLNVFSYAQLD